MRVVWCSNLAPSARVPGSFCFPRLVSGPGTAFQVLKDEFSEIPIKHIRVRETKIDIKYAFAASSDTDVYFNDSEGRLFRLDIQSGAIQWFERGITTGPVRQSCVSLSGHVLSVGYEPWAFDYFSPDGHLVLSGYELQVGAKNLPGFVGLDSIISLGCSTISANGNSFILGGGPAKHRLDKFSLDGTYTSTYDLSPEGLCVGYDIFPIANAHIRLDGEIIATDGFSIIRISPEGRIKSITRDIAYNNMRVMLDEIFFIDEDMLVWSMCIESDGKNAYLVAISL